jgi:hypothetical protein
MGRTGRSCHSKPGREQGIVAVFRAVSIVQEPLIMLSIRTNMAQSVAGKYPEYTSFPSVKNTTTLPTAPGIG